MATSLNSTTLSAAITASQTIIPVASATNITAPVGNLKQQIYVIGPGQPRGELMTVTSVSGTQIGVSRLDEYKAFWPSGSLVLIGPAPLASSNFVGKCSAGSRLTTLPALRPRTTRTRPARSRLLPG